MPWRVTGIIKNGADMPQDIILSIVFGIFRTKNVIFAFVAFFVPENHVFWPFFGRFLIIGMPFFS
jgi:hypothetical protein